MKKWLKTIIPVFAFAFILLFSGIQAQAGTITSVNAEAGDNEFTVSGKAGDGVLSVVIFVYDSTGTKLLQMKSVAVDSNHSYTDTFEAEVGTYVVKVADYEGGAFKETSVTVEQIETTTQAETTTQTETTTQKETTVTSTEKAEETTVSKDETKADATVSDTTGNKTGDSSPVMPLAVLAAVALVSVVAVAVSKKHA